MTPSDIGWPRIASSEGAAPPAALEASRIDPARHTSPGRFNAPTRPGHRLAEWPIPLAAGAELRPVHLLLGLEQWPDLAWIEIQAESHFRGKAESLVVAARRDRPVSMQIAALPRAGARGMDFSVLRALVGLSRRIEPGLISVQLAGAGALGRTEASLRLNAATQTMLAHNIDALQGALKQTVLIKNAIAAPDALVTDTEEAAVLAQLAKSTGCGIMLDIDHVVQAADAVGSKPSDRLRSLLDDLPIDAIGELQLSVAPKQIREQAGGPAHGATLCPRAWNLFVQAIQRIGPQPTLIRAQTGVVALSDLRAGATSAEISLVCARANLEWS